VTISVQIIVLEQPYGNPGSIGEPLGIWSGAVDVAGDAGGGFVVIQFQPRNPTTTPTLPDARREFVYFCDGATMLVLGSITPDDMRVEYQTHWARANVVLATPSQHILNSNPLNIASQFAPNQPIYDSYISRFPMFWDAQELGLANNDLVVCRFESNDLLSNFRARCWGRYYDRQILANRAFGRLISPPAISQF